MTSATDHGGLSSNKKSGIQGKRRKPALPLQPTTVATVAAEMDISIKTAIVVLNRNIDRTHTTYEHTHLKPAVVAKLRRYIARHPELVRKGVLSRRTKQDSSGRPSDFPPVAKLSRAAVGIRQIGDHRLCPHCRRAVPTGYLSKTLLSHETAEGGVCPGSGRSKKGIPRVRHQTLQSTTPRQSATTSSTGTKSTRLTHKQRDRPLPKTHRLVREATLKEFRFQPTGPDEYSATRKHQGPANAGSPGLGKRR